MILAWSQKINGVWYRTGDEVAQTDSAIQTSPEQSDAAEDKVNVKAKYNITAKSDVIRMNKEEVGRVAVDLGIAISGKTASEVKQIVIEAIGF